MSNVWNIKVDEHPYRIELKSSKIIVNNETLKLKDYVPVVTPKWAYVFVVLHLLNLFNGVIGIITAIFGSSITVSVSSHPKFNIAVKVWVLD